MAAESQLIYSHLASSPDDYVLKLQWHVAEPNFTALLSNGVAKTFTCTASELCETQSSQQLQSSPFVDLAVSTRSSAIFGCQNDGIVLHYDARAAVGTPLTNIPAEHAPLSLGCSEDGCFVVIGCEQRKPDAPVYVYDTRNASEPMSTLMDAHQDDVVTVQFSHHDANRFLTGSTDGTVNVHDLSLLDGAELPEDVLALTAKTSSSIHHTGYFGNQDRLLYAVTHDGSLGLWHALPTDDVDQELILWVDSPKTVLDGLEVPTDYVVDALYNEKNEQLYLLAGSHSGLAHLSHVSMGELTPVCPLLNGHATTVRCCDFSSEHQLLVTGDEAATLSLWQLT